MPIGDGVLVVVFALELSLGFALTCLTWVKRRRIVDTAEVTLQTPTDAVIRADPKRLRRILENLFRYAVEHGGEDVTVEVGTIDAAEAVGVGSGGAKGFSVVDDGPGIPAAEREEVFERGYSTGGTGLGLSIVRRIAEAHGWSVEATASDAGRVRFEFTGVRVKS